MKSINLPAASGLHDPMLGFRFGVYFLGKSGNVDLTSDFRFQSISGLSLQVGVGKEGGVGNQVVGQVLPETLAYSNLILKRGMPLKSTLSSEVQESLNVFRFNLRDVLVSVLDEEAQPIKSWKFFEAYPVKWSLSGLDAESSSFLIEEIELKYLSFKPFSL